MVRSYGVAAWLAVLAVAGSLPAQTAAPAPQTAPAATAPAATTPAAPATPQQIDAAVAQLGEPAFQTREAATRFLLGAGKAAEPALTKAVESPDTEVRIRAQQLLADIKMGISPDVPPNVAALLRQYRLVNSPLRNQVITKLSEEGPAGAAALLRLADGETNTGLQRAILRALLTKGGIKIGEALRAGNAAVAERILELGRDAEDVPIYRAWLAYQFVNGKADAVIRELDAPARQADGRVPRHQLYFYRLKGDLPRAIKAAEAVAARGGDRRYSLALRVEEGDWKTIAELFESDKTRGTYGKQAAVLAWHFGGNETMSRALLARLPAPATPPGMPAGFAKTPSWHFDAPALLLFTDRVDDAIKALEQQEYPIPAFEARCLRGQYAEAFAGIPPVGPQTLSRQIYLYISQVRQLMKLGEKAKAWALLDQLGAQHAARPDAQMTYTLMGIEREAGRPEKALERALAEMGKDARGAQTDMLLNSLVGNAGKIWWDLLEQLDEGMPRTERLKKVDALVRQTVPAEELEKLVGQIRKNVEENGFANQDEVERYGPMIAPALTAAGYRGTWLADVPRPAPRRGKTAPPPAVPPAPDTAREAAAKGQWAQAAELYSQQINPGPNYSSEYLQGYCLTQLGRKAEGAKLMQEADLCMLADDALRLRTADHLEDAGAKDLAERQRRIVVALGDPASSLRPHPGLLDSAAQEADAKRGVALWEQRMAAMMYSGRMLGANNAQGGEIGTYLEFAAQHHRLRARAALQGGNVEGALAEARAALAVLPTDVDVALDVAPLLDKAQQKAAGDALVGTIVDTHERILKDYPQAAATHAALARLCTGTGRRLELALEHAKKAAELVPENAEYQDVLAEAHFVRGEVQEAIALEKKLVEANPGVALYAEQLARFSAAASQPAGR